ncbi:hypothetical protein TNCV_1039101 [Trichonephila clavipes]|uniref:Uncharacterized protein n=1 Tax=Trichonephila clavipes TaxID=2585209 RepID=A0A8X7B8T7_TRICX|nr:hypothetical protein TNCV_1039101 [Trichonephila clavipes]
MNVAILLRQITAGFFRRNNLLRISTPSSVSMVPLPMQPFMVCREGFHTVNGPAVVDISTPVTVDQRADNCMEEVSRTFIAMQIRYLP